MDHNNTKTQPNPERWLPVLGYEGLYEVSDHGRIKTCARIQVQKNGTRYPVKERIRKLVALEKRGGYYAITLSRAGSVELKYIHVMVLEAFAGPRPAGKVACHNDGVPTNNHISNLRWDSPTGNNFDKQRHGTDHQRNKTHCPYGHSLQLPNLVKATWKRGYRHCLACSRTRAHMQRNPHDKPNYQIISDQYLQQIMAP